MATWLFSHTEGYIANDLHSFQFEVRNSHKNTVLFQNSPISPAPKFSTLPAMQDRGVVSMLSLRDASHPAAIETCEVSLSLYGYLPSRPANLAFLAIFGILFLGHVVLGVMRRSWSFLVALGMGTMMEVIGTAY